MDTEEAIALIYDGLVSENSVPVKLRTNRELDSDILDQVREALDVLTQYYKDKETVPKKLALAMVDINGAFSFRAGYFWWVFGGIRGNRYWVTRKGHRAFF